MGDLLQTLRNLGPARLGAIGGAAIVVIGLLIFAATRLSTPNMGLLYANLSTKDSGAVAQKLDSMNVPYVVRGDGSIMAPADQVPKLRLAMAQDGLPHDGSTGYELFDKPEGLGTTDFTQNINRVRALEGELERTIGLIDSIDSARVHLVLPTHELFTRQTQEPSASIMLKIHGRAGLSRAQVAAIQNLVATAVPGLKPYHVAIVDQAGHLLAKGTGEPGQGGYDGVSDADQQRMGYENRIARSIDEILAQSMGDGHVRTDVNADMDFSRVTTNSETYDPNGQVVRSTQTVNQNSSNTDGSSDQPVTVQTNLPDGQQTQANSSSSGSKSTRNEETTNYEISKSSTVQTREGGIIKRISVAVLVDGSYQPDKNGVMTYQPRSPQELAQITDLVKTAMGYDAKRGDQVQVTNMRFAGENLPQVDAPIIFGMTKADLFHIFETVVLAVVALLVMLLVVRPLVSRGLEAMRESAMRENYADGMVPAGALAGGPNLAALTGPGGGLVPAGEDEDDEEIMVDISKVEGRVKASSMRKIGEIVDKHPEEAVAIIRNWMYRAS